MGRFNQQNEKMASGRGSVFDCDCLIDKRNWFQVFSACLGKMTAIQNACFEIVVRDQDWNADFSRGVISFGAVEFPMQFIGSESISDGSWLWGWENINGFDEGVISLAKSTRKIGGQWGLEPLVTAEFELSDMFNGHSMAVVTCGISENELCYYRGPHSGGAVLASFSGVPAQVFAPVGISQFTTIVMQCIQQFHIDHRIFLESFLLWNGTKYEWDGYTLIARFEQELHIEFEPVEKFSRIKSIKTQY